ncbi:50S ribosomal protein L25/general stress protein Ctc [Lysinibacillus sp. KU-BSD001]|uniref:50S ribosomal protein L25/general stress protein Ctc n=1 Tax=Lysinibacillus sp. KU-BSD001 TaxID=3141328 RepID=UPI0036F0013F
MSTVLAATTREIGSRSILTKIRNSGGIPANVYGYQTVATPIQVGTKDLTKAMQASGQNTVFALSLGGETVNAVISEIQRCALKGNIKHIDFQAINMSEELEVEVPIAIVGESFGVKDGGVLMQPIHTLKIKVKPMDMPESIEVDVSTLNIGDTLSVADIRGNSKFELLNADEDTLVTITPPASEPADAIDSAEKEPTAIETPEADA